MNNENFQGARKGEPEYDNYGGQGQDRCFYGKWKNLNSVLKDVLNNDILTTWTWFYVWPNLVGR